MSDQTWPKLAEDAVARARLARDAIAGISTGVFGVACLVTSLLPQIDDLIQACESNVEHQRKMAEEERDG